jgi:DNA-binding transcriptional ArsR family regulator
MAMKIQNHIKTRAEVLKDFSEAYDARFFKTLGEPVRIQILSYLMMKCWLSACCAVKKKRGTGITASTHRYLLTRWSGF